MNQATPLTSKRPPISLPPGTIQDMITFYKRGVSIKELADKNGIEESAVKSAIKDFVKLHGRDSISENEAIIKMAEQKLIELARRMECGSTDSNMFVRYRALLFWYCKADLNEGIVFIPKNLLS